MNQHNCDRQFTAELDAINQAQRGLMRITQLRDNARQNRQRYQEGMLNLAIQRAEAELNGAYQRLGRAVADWHHSADHQADAKFGIDSQPYQPSAKDSYDAVKVVVWNRLEELIRSTGSGSSVSTMIDNIRKARYEILKAVGHLAGYDDPENAEWQAARGEQVIR